MAYLLEWLRLLSRDLPRKYPRLIDDQALMNLLAGDLEEGKRYLDESYELENKEAARRNEYIGMLAVVRTCYCIFSGDFLGALRYAEESLGLLPESAYFWRISAAISYGDVKFLDRDAL